VGNRIIAIDPGAKGGIAYRDQDGIMQAERMPDGMTAICDRIRALGARGYDGAVVERVGTYVKGNAVGGAVKFARHCGWLDAALYMAGIGLVAWPTPRKWQRSLGTLPKAKQDRKRAIRERMARQHPHLRVTLQTADALAMLEWWEAQ